MKLKLNEFMRKCLPNWSVAGITTYGNERGHIKMRNKDSVIKLYFKFNGAKYWTEDSVTIYYIEGCDMM